MINQLQIGYNSFNMSMCVSLSFSLFKCLIVAQAMKLQMFQFFSFQGTFFNLIVP